MDGSSHRGKHARRTREHRVDRREPAELARHVVCRRRHWTEGRTADDELDVAKSNQIREIRMSAGELLDLHRLHEVETGI